MQVVCPVLLLLLWPGPPGFAFPALQYLLHRGSTEQQRRSLTRTPNYTQAHSGAGISAGKMHETKLLMCIHSHTCSHKNMHTFSTTRAPYCALERPTSTKGRSISFFSTVASSSQKHFKSYRMSTTEIFQKEENRYFCSFFLF